MNADQQRQLALKIEAALAHAGIAVERPVQEGGNIVRWQDVPGESMIAAFLTRQWRVCECEPPATATGTLPPWPAHDRRHGLKVEP